MPVDSLIHCQSPFARKAHQSAGLSVLLAGPHIGPWFTGSLEAFSPEHAIVPREHVCKLLDHNSDKIVAAIDTPSSLLDCQSDGLVVAFGELGSGR